MPDEIAQPDASSDDDELVIRARTDRVALGVLYDRYYPRVLRYAARRLLDLSLAEDATSDVFLQVARHLRDFGGSTETDFRRWLFRIATNAVAAQARKARRRGEIWKAAAEAGEWEHKSESAPTDYERLDWPVVQQALEEMEEREQSIVLLRFFAELSHDEIAAVVGMTPGSVRTALSRALARLRERFDPSRSKT